MFTSPRAGGMIFLPASTDFIGGAWVGLAGGGQDATERKDRNGACER